ncbi:hypothetical protein [Micromonospora globbae]|uniref:hypothetical protein n=1 Tax=Micromonospora globbae TaxID=1894969 RepID=UPI001F013605|nr:hypothetical protein [Micromonospora globbae]
MPVTPEWVSSWWLVSAWAGRSSGRQMTMVLMVGAGVTSVREAVAWARAGGAAGAEVAFAAVRRAGMAGTRLP